MTAFTNNSNKLSRLEASVPINAAFPFNAHVLRPMFMLEIL